MARARATGCPVARATPGWFAPGPGRASAGPWSSSRWEARKRPAGGPRPSTPSATCPGCASPGRRATAASRTDDASTLDGWEVDGWEAWEYEPGEVDPHDHDVALEVADRFHTATETFPTPSFVASRDDPWSAADRVAWGEADPPAHTLGDALVERLLAAREPVRVQDQPVHGDLLGNVLHSPRLPPAVIGWAVYHRPAAWTAAVVVVDALTWYDAPASLVERQRWHGTAEAPSRQLLVRAALFRACLTPADGLAHATTVRRLLALTDPD